MQNINNSMIYWVNVTVVMPISNEILGASPLAICWQDFKNWSVL